MGPSNDFEPVLDQGRVEGQPLEMVDCGGADRESDTCERGTAAANDAAPSSDSDVQTFAEPSFTRRFNLRPRKILGISTKFARILSKFTIYYCFNVYIAYLHV